MHADERSVAAGRDIINSQIYTGNVNVAVIEAEALKASSRGALPARPVLLTGRNEDLAALKIRLGITTGGAKTVAPQSITVVRGWVGVGKTTLAAAIAHDPEIDSAFPDGILWISLGAEPNILAGLAAWGRSLGNLTLTHALDAREASYQLAALLRNKRMLLVIDDVWDVAHAEPFKVGGRGCATVITTRSDTIAQALSATPDDVYRLGVLSPEFAFELLSQLAPGVANKHPEECRELVSELGGLPLALQVAGRMLHAESRFGWGIGELLEALRSGKKLLEAQAPSDRADVILGTTPTVAVLLEKSTERLEPEVRDRFALLGVFAPEPWSFDLDALKAMWLADDPKDTVRELVSRGLLETAPGRERFQIHALLALHAKSMLTE